MQNDREKVEQDGKKIHKLDSLWKRAGSQVSQSDKATNTVKVSFEDT